MARELKQITFHFYNGGRWAVPVELIDDIRIDKVTKGLRKQDGKYVESSFGEYLQIEFLPEADTTQSEDINKGSLETGMFETVIRNDDIERLQIEWDNGQELDAHFPFEPSTPGGTDNIYMTAKKGENGRLYVVISYDKDVDDVYPDK